LSILSKINVASGVGVGLGLEGRERIWQLHMKEVGEGEHEIDVSRRLFFKH
jgi:hypothetical protein